MTTKYKEVLQQIDQLKSEAAALRQTAIVEAKERIKVLMEGHNLNWEEVGAPVTNATQGRAVARKAGRKRQSASAAKPKTGGKRQGAKDGRSVVTPKYRDPKSGATWSGRGKTPRWIAAELKKGKTREHFAIAR
ncbi:MAG: H-NS family nucleoid-associated regulatory protein [Planctomycetota bacterium]|nr:H-NS family nucleoid-associated regulatory protein [Planctomycetota bacterium]MDA1106731.1 H-NS family nucleoid-associated regulatory protein [Planctomycetota bacterium]